VDPNNPNIVYHVLNGTLRKSTLGGAAGTWSTLNTINGPQFPTLYFPFVIDSVNSSRLVVGGGESFGAPGAGRRNNGPLGSALQETLDGGATWVDLQTAALDNLNLPAPPVNSFFPPGTIDWYEVIHLALPSYQGTFQPDPAF